MTLLQMPESDAKVRTGSILGGEKGQTMIEYALVAVLIAIALIFMFKGAGLDSSISSAGGKVNSSLSTPP